MIYIDFLNFFNNFIDFTNFFFIKIELLHHNCRKETFIKYFKTLYCFCRDGLLKSTTKISEDAGVNVKYCSEWTRNIRDVCGRYHHQNITKLGLLGSIIEYDGYYHKKKSNLDKKMKKLPTWFKGLVVQRFIERDYNIWGSHNSFSFIIKSESKHALTKMHKYVVKGAELHSDGCGNLGSNILKDEKFQWTVHQCNHSKFVYVTYKPGKNALTATSSEKVHNNLVENSWKQMDILYNIKRGFGVLNANDTLDVYQSWLYWFDWINTYTNRKTGHKVIQFLNHLSQLYVPRIQ